MTKGYLESAKAQFKHYKSIGEKTFDQLKDDDFFWQYNEESNSVAIIVNHIWGNMMSRWTDFLTTDGEKEWRNRDAEFETTVTSKEDLIKIATYIYDNEIETPKWFDTHFKQNHKKGQGMGNLNNIEKKS